MDKVWDSAEEVIANVYAGATRAIARFFTAGMPRVLLRALVTKGVQDVTLACGCGPLLGCPDELAQLVKNRQLKKVIDSYGLYRHPCPYWG